MILILIKYAVLITCFFIKKVGSKLGVYSIYVYWGRPNFFFVFAQLEGSTIDYKKRNIFEKKIIL